MTDLWPHQERGLAMLRQSLRNGSKRPVLMLPTGGGKTKLAARIVAGALEKSNEVCFCVPAISLIDQTVRAFGAEGIRDVGVIQADHPLHRPLARVQVASVQTLARRKFPDSRVVIVDECHQQFEVIRRWMAERPDVTFIGLSATPWAKGMGKHYDALVIAGSTQELIEAGRLSKFRVFAPSHPDLSKVHTVAGDYHEGELAEAMDKPELTADVVRTWLRLGENRPTLCFAVNRGHARSLEQQFERAGVPVAYIDANTPREERQKLGDALEAGRLKVIVNIATMTTGVDLDVRCLILARPTKSEMLYVQIIGRALRAADGKSDAIILDHSDTTLKLGFVTDIRHDALDDGTPRKASTRKQRDHSPSLPKECPSCHAVKPAGVRRCPECGFEPVYREEVAVREGDLDLLRGEKLADDRATKQRWWSGLAWYVEQRGKTEQWASWRYRDRFGVWPRSLRWLPREPDMDVRNWVKASAIRFAKGSAVRQQIAKGRSNVVGI